MNMSHKMGNVEAFLKKQEGDLLCVSPPHSGEYRKIRIVIMKKRK